MPATAELKARWIDEATAMKQLGQNFVHANGVLAQAMPKDLYTPTVDDLSAIKFLCDEYNFQYAE